MLVGDSGRVASNTTDGEDHNAPRPRVKAVRVRAERVLDMDQNLEDFERSFVPLLKAAKDRGLEYRVEQCPMPGWTTKDLWHNQIGYTPGMWIRLHRIAERHKVGDQLRIHYDPSHAILMGQNTRDIFQFLKDEGYAFLIGGFHVKGQVINPKAVAEWGYGGQPVERGDARPPSRIPTWASSQRWPSRSRWPPDAGHGRHDPSPTQNRRWTG